MAKKIVPLSSLTLDKENVRYRGERAKEVLQGSLEEFGAVRSVVMDADGIIRAGNGTVEAAIAAGVKKARIVKGSKDVLVVVRRSDLEGEQAKAYAVVDNRTSDLAEWEAGALKRHLESLPGIDLGFTQEEIEQLGWLGRDPADDQAIPEHRHEAETYSIRVENVTKQDQEEVTRAIAQAIQDTGYEVYAV